MTQSAYAHGQQWSILSAKITAGARLPGISAVRHVRIQAYDQLTVAAAVETVKALRLATEELEDYAGAPSPPSKGGA